MEQKPFRGLRILIATLLGIAALFMIGNMVMMREPLTFSVLWHWVFIIGFLAISFINLRAKSFVGTSIGLSGFAICLTSLIVMAL
ncbi:hypothetical protein HB912_12560 [Listeria aquatica]|uniref:Uncharacterized protein n=1 Tax=Listeria aquatica TaxID=1494960 RepID=A0A841ZUA0_9LIST|nr:hypothetical protein [Listeria aquatica]MBC1522480.1 hypothetical protein [Listeria aquatica]